MSNDISFKSDKEKLQIIFNSLNGFNDEATFNFNNEDMSIICLNKEKSAYLFFNINKNYFQEYLSEKNEKFNLLIDKIKTVIDKCSGSIQINISKVVKITSKSTYTIEAKLPVILNEGDIPIIEDKEYPNKIGLDIDQLKEIVEILTSFSQFVEITINSNLKQVKISSKEAGGSSIDIDVPKIEAKTILKKDIKLIFNAKNLKSLISNLSNLGESYLFIGENQPVKMIYKEDDIKIMLYTALCQE